MKHGRKNRRFGRKDNVRLGFMRSLAIALIDSGQIQTTEARAKTLRPYIEKLITKALEADLASFRTILARLGNNMNATKKLCEEIAPKYKSQAGGYTRIVKLPPRDGDGSPLALIEFIN